MSSGMGGAISVPVKNHWLYDFSKSQTQEVWMGKLDIRRSTELTSPSPEIHLARRYKSFESEFKSEQCTVISINIGGGGNKGLKQWRLRGSVSSCVSPGAGQP